MPVDHTTESTDGPPVVIHNHPIYYFDDGSLILDIDTQRFKIHRSLLSRHSGFFSRSADMLSNSEMIPSSSTSGLLGLLDGVPRIVLGHSRPVRPEDVEALLQHFYHDVLLGQDSSFTHLASILRVSGPDQLDFPQLHANTREILDSMFRNDPSPFAHNHPLHEALAIAKEFNLTSVRKSILYSLVTTTEFDADASDSTATIVDPHQSLSPASTIDVSTPSPNLKSESNAPIVGATVDSHSPTSGSNIQVTPGVLSPADVELCMALMTRFIERFTPILFTPAATPHMSCTDVFADTWMPLVIQPALDDDGVYKPLETLEKIKNIRWEEHGLCKDCVAEKRDEWTHEQRTMWKLMDSWLER